MGGRLGSLALPGAAAAGAAAACRWGSSSALGAGDGCEAEGQAEARGGPPHGGILLLLQRAGAGLARLMQQPSRHGLQRSGLGHVGQAAVMLLLGCLAL